MYERYCKLRDERGVKDATVAKETGIGKSTFSDWKSGRSVPKKEKLMKIADFFHVPLDELIGAEKDDEEKALEKDMYVQLVNRYLAYLLGIKTSRIVTGLMQLNADGLEEIENRIDEMLCVPKYRNNMKPDGRVFLSGNEDELKRYDSMGREIKE